MLSKKESCRAWKLYVIADRQSLKNLLLSEAVRLAIEGGADVIQLRDKAGSDKEMIADAREILKWTQAKDIPLIINDRLPVALTVEASGVHLGQDDASLGEARKALGLNTILGRSTHSPEQLLKAQSEGFDYVGVGPVFSTPTKPSYTPVGLELVRFAAKNATIPFVAIGGIDTGNAALVKRAGAFAIAVVRAVIGSSDPRQASKDLKNIF